MFHPNIKLHSEQIAVLDALCNERNLALISSNNSIRVDIIQVAFSLLKEQESDAITYYIDIANTQNLDEVSCFL